ncbi:MAG: hydrogenase 4 subunit B [Ferrovum myxofaciens]|uniref:hydrogenase 4 subunit B n=1 Tax=Ferrovum myxofaciens TaxID=416213 RepID=UPI002352533C|nr:hydrogenase 4 subunit B [Ferrovum myxofaciens]QKE42068.1 MAG: hydrogenase 4 subunit B [Ferrovum myxofaciens]
MSLLPLDLVGLILTGLSGLGLLGLVLPARLGRCLLFPLIAGLSALMAGAGLWALQGGAQTLVLPIGLPGMPFHLRLDVLSAFFLTLLGLAGSGISAYATGYFRHMAETQPGDFQRLILLYALFLASMGMVLVADDAYFFMVAWESMALSSYFLVTTDHEIPAIREAGFLYLLMAHLGAIALLLCFGLLQSGTGGDYAFATLRHHSLTSFWSSTAFILALIGFGAKAGLLPLHTWLPEAHPAAPSPVSALMSGIMLKMALYGLLRVLFDLLGQPLWWWGALLVGLGSLTALFGVLFAAVQSDIKRLLAWSSVENMGLILSGLGLTLLFHGAGQETVAALALAAVLYHALNHAFFKGLLFLGAGSVLHATAERNMAKLGGLIRVMPWVAGLSLVGALSLAGLPPFNGFVSEWLLLQAYLLRPDLPQPWLNMVLPLGAAVLALVGALAGFAMVKFYGIVFLGQARGLVLSEVQDIGVWERFGMGWMALGCVLLGLFPSSVILQLDTVTHALVGQGLGASAARHGWLWVTPVSANRASYSPLILFAVIGVSVGLTFLGVRRFFHGRWRRAPAWDCGYPFQTARMQDSADGFGQPIKQIFESFFGLSREIPSPFDSHPHYHSEVRDPLWALCYLPLVRGVARLVKWVGVLQQGRISTYLLFSFTTLMALLALVTGSRP